MLAKAKIQYKNKTKYIPQSWWSLNRKQFLNVHKLFNTRIFFDEQRILLLKELLSMPNRLFYKLTVDQLQDLLRLTSFLYEDETPTITNNPLSSFWLQGVRYVASDAMANKMTADEYARLDVAIYNFIKKNEIQYLYELAAILYRPISIKRTIRNIFSEDEMDTRVKLTDKSIARRANRFKMHMPLHYIDAIKFIYIEMQEYFFKSFPLVFEKAKDENSETEARNDYGWSGVIINMAGPKFGTINQTMQQPIVDIMVVLQFDLEKVREAEFNSMFKR